MNLEMPADLLAHALAAQPLHAGGRGRAWAALVVYLDDQISNEWHTVLRWVRAEQLRPVVSDPNAMGWRRRVWR